MFCSLTTRTRWDVLQCCFQNSDETLDMNYHAFAVYIQLIARHMEIKSNIQYIQVNLSSWKVWKIAQSGSVPFRGHFERSTGPTPAQHLPSLEHLSTRGPPLSGPRPLLLPRCGCYSSRCLSRCCWPPTLRRGPVARAMVSRKTYDAINKDIRDAW